MTGCPAAATRPPLVAAWLLTHREMLTGGWLLVGDVATVGGSAPTWQSATLDDVPLDARAGLVVVVDRLPTPPELAAAAGRLAATVLPGGLLLVLQPVQTLGRPRVSDLAVLTAAGFELLDAADRAEPGGETGEPGGSRWLRLLYRNNPAETGGQPLPPQADLGQNFPP